MADASKTICALLDAGIARDARADEPVHFPHLVDIEVGSGLRRAAGNRSITAEAGWHALDTWRRLGVVRHPASGLLDRSWQLRANVSAYDAAYVALAEALGCGVLTADARLSRAPGLRCPVAVVPG